MEVDRKPEEASAAAAPPATDEEVLKSIVALLEKSVKAKDTRLLMGRLLRQTAAVRKQLSPAAIKAFLRQTLPTELEAQAFLAAHLEVQWPHGPVPTCRGACIQLHVQTERA
jgi:26S proteasome regulatory subunit N3